MAHVQLINYTSPRNHRYYVKEVSRWKYPVIGKVRKGWFRPYHAQVFVDDFRVPSICQDQFISDIEGRDFSGFLKREEFKGKLIGLLIKLARFIGPWSNKPVTYLKPMNYKSGWKYNVLIGVVDDPRQICKIDGKYKEVL